MSNGCSCPGGDSCGGFGPCAFGDQVVLDRPDDLVTALLWYREDTEVGVTTWAVPNPERHPEPCRVYWGSHGCDRPRGHDGPHWCDCCTCKPGEHPNPTDEDGDEYHCVGGPPYYGNDTHFYGDDAPTAPAGSTASDRSTRV